MYCVQHYVLLVQYTQLYPDPVKSEGILLYCSIHIEVLFVVKMTVFILILFASLLDCGQNEIAVSDEQYSRSDF